MEINKIKISDEFMDALVDKFFTSEVINCQRKLDNAVERLKDGSLNMHYHEKPMLEVKAGSKVNHPYPKGIGA